MGGRSTPDRRRKKPQNGVFRTPARALLAAVAVARSSHPVRPHHGIGLGPIAPRIDPAFPGPLDGRAFHRARTAVKHRPRQRAWLARKGLPLHRVKADLVTCLMPPIP